jgi:hypothetical protein
LAEEYGSLRNFHGGNKSKRFKHHTCYERPKVYGMLACVSYDMHVKMAYLNSSSHPGQTRSISSHRHNVNSAILFGGGNFAIVEIQ